MTTPTFKQVKSPPTQAQLDHKANQKNANPGTSGTNLVNSKVHGNRGAQGNPNRRTS